MDPFGGILKQIKAPTITSWVRLEPRSRDAEMNTSLQARIYDPLWLLTRQWQLGEFEGEDNGSPVIARWRGETARLNRYLPGAPSTASIHTRPYDVRVLPLETLVERERARPDTTSSKSEKLTFAVRAGQHLIRLLDSLFDQEALSQSYSELFKSRFSFVQQPNELDGESLNFFNLVAPRVPDGRRLYAALRPLGSSAVKLPKDLAILPTDLAEVEKAVAQWLQWYDTFFSEPDAGPPSWSAERMEYSMSVAGRFSDAEKVLTAQEYFEGHLDWHAFDLNLNQGVSLGAPVDGNQVTCTTIPAPVSFHGMPAARFWEFEDAQVDFGSVDAGPTDLARMLLVEFALAYGNDWFVIPVELEVGSLCRSRSLVVTDTFGVRTLIKPSSELGPPHSSWRMFQLSGMRTPGAQRPTPAPNLFFLSPSLVKSLKSKPLEEVLFLRDEMANMAWAVERLIESPSERPLNRYEAYVEQQRLREQDVSPPQSAELQYGLATEVPDYWIPLLPVRVGTGLRLRRGAVLKIDGTREPARAQGRVLESNDELSLFEEEVQREGVCVTRSYQFTRWIDGSSHLWIGRSKEVGQGEGSSGLRFDSLEPKP